MRDSPSGGLSDTYEDTGEEKETPYLKHYSLSGVMKMCTQLDDQQDIVKKTALEAARPGVLLASGLFEDVNRVYGEEHE